MKHKLGLPIKLKDESVIFYSYAKNILVLQTEKKVIARIKSLRTLLTIEELALEECRNISDVEFIVKGKESSSIRLV